MTTPHPRTLGLDLGEKRIGIAISDPHGNTAAGLETITRKDMQTDVAAIADLSKRHNVVEIVIGIPKNTEDSESDHSQKVMSFGKKLTMATGLPVIYEDERLSSVSSIRTLVVQRAKTLYNKPLENMHAAAVILQLHLDRKEPPPTA